MPQIKFGWLDGFDYIDFGGSRDTAEFIVNMRPESATCLPQFWIYAGEAGWQCCDCGEQALWLQIQTEEFIENYFWVKGCREQEEFMRQIHSGELVIDGVW
jgi:hypothetical protein